MTTVQAYSPDIFPNIDVALADVLLNDKETDRIVKRSDRKFTQCAEYRCVDLHTPRKT